MEEGGKSERGFSRLPELGIFIAHAASDQTGVAIYRYRRSTIGASSAQSLNAKLMVRLCVYSCRERERERQREATLDFRLIRY